MDKQDVIKKFRELYPYISVGGDVIYEAYLNTDYDLPIDKSLDLVKDYILSMELQDDIEL